MNTQKNVLIFSSGGMILSVFYACTSFIFASISQKPISLSDAAVILFMATLITSIHSQRGWRQIYIIGLHTWGLLFTILRLCHNYFGFESSFWLFQWVQEFLLLERPAAGWFVLILILFCISILWFCGIRLATKPTDQTTISHRFDSGLGFLLLLIVIKLLIATKGVSIPVEHSATRPFISFIILGHLFPQIEKEIRLIVNLHDEAVYGGIPPDKHHLSRARLAFRRIRNPLLWIARIKSLCFQNP